MHCSSWTMLNAMHQCTVSVLLKDKIVIVIVTNICRNSNISQQYCLLVFTPCLVKKKNSRFWHSSQHCDELFKCWVHWWHIWTWPLQFPSYRPYLVHTVNHSDSEWWSNCDYVIFYCFVCLLAKQHAAFSTKRNFLDFLFCQPSSVETPLKWKLKQLIISISGKITKYPFMFVKVIANLYVCVWHMFGTLSECLLFSDSDIQRKWCRKMTIKTSKLLFRMCGP